MSTLRLGPSGLAQSKLFLHQAWLQHRACFMIAEAKNPERRVKRGVEGPLCYNAVYEALVSLRRPS